MSEIVSSLIALAFAILSTIGFARWLRAEMAQTDGAKPAAAKRNYFYSLLALVLVVCVGIAVTLVGFERNPMRAVALGLGAMLAGIVPVIHWMMLSQIGFMGLEGEGPVTLSRASRRRLRLPLLASVGIALVAAAFLVWLGGGDPPIVPLEFAALGAVALTVAALIWPILVVKRCIAFERGGGRGGDRA